MTWGKRRAIVIGVLILVFIGLIWVASKPTAMRIPTNGVLVINASGEIAEQQAPDIFSALSGMRPLVLHDYLDAIDTAATDSHVTGLVVRIGPLETGWAKLEEMRNHLLSFRKSGKPSICYLGYDGIQNPEYYLASACQQIWLVPTAPVSIRGMMAEALFLRGTLDKLKIVPEFYHIAEFKTATNMFTEKKFTPAHREEVEGLLRSVYNQYLDDASKGRNMDRAQFETLLNKGPFASSDAVTNKIVDRLGYWDQVQDYFKARDRKWSPISLNQYRASVRNEGSSTIAVVHASGLIVSGDSGSTPGGGSVMGGDSVAADIRSARQNSNVKAIVLRVDSGAARWWEAK
jgi:protease IV